jgi:hypothetical protein
MPTENEQDPAHREHSLHRDQEASSDPLLQLYGSGKEIWADEPADEYVKRLRDGWE